MKESWLLIRYKLKIGKKSSKYGIYNQLNMDNIHQQLDNTTMSNILNFMTYI